MTDWREETEMSLSQLADGELSSDQANDLLLDVLDDDSRRAELRQVLRLRQATARWRNRQPAQPVMVVADRQDGHRHRHSAWTLAGLAAAACIGGLLVLAGVWATGLVANSHQPQSGPPVATTGQPKPPASDRVTPEQMQQVAKVFAFHESVAGPLEWYAADDQTIRLASDRGTDAGQAPIAVVLKLGPAGPDQQSRTLVIVCREGQSAAIDLPAESPEKPGLRVWVDPRSANGSVDVRFSIAVGPPDGAGSRRGNGEAAGRHSGTLTEASLSGERRLGLTETSLGEMAVGDRLVKVGASAWTMPKEQN